MTPSSRLRAVIIGAGNVAWGLAPALERGGAVTIVRVVSRDISHAQALADALCNGAEASATVAGCDCDADLVFIAASDDAVASIARTCTGSQAVWLHTSGSVDCDVLATASSNYGVIYPMQTFTRGIAVDLSSSPLYIEASSPELKTMLRDIASTVTTNVREADSEGRRRLHCAAVFACNFTNHLWDIADKIAHTAGASLSDFMPLIDETLRKARTIGPHAAQTGPARRGAASVMKAHEELLSPDDSKLYHLLSLSIKNAYEQD